MSKIIKVDAHLSIGYSGATHKETISVELDDEYTESEKENAIDEVVQDWANNFIEISWSEKP